MTRSRTLQIAGLLALVGVLLFLRKMKKSRLLPGDQPPKNSLVVIVTGGASGIGKHLTTRFLAKGHKVVSVDLNYSALEENYRTLWQSNGQRCVIKKLDIRSPDDWKQVVDETVKTFGSLDIMLNVAGYIHPATGYEFDPKQVDLHIDINIKGTIYGSQVAAQQMIKQRSGHIINFSSVAGLFFVPGLTLYASSKHGVRGYTRSLAFELREKGIYVTCVCPDPVETPMLEKQKSFKEATLTFSSKSLTVEDVEKVIFEKVLTEKPYEVIIPAWRGFIAGCVNLIPDFIADLTLQQSLRDGAQRQAKLVGRL